MRARAAVREAYLHAHLPTYLSTFPPTHLYTYTPTHLRTYAPTHLPTHPPTHPPTHLPAQVRSRNELQFEGLSDAGAGALTKLRSYRQVMIVTSFVLRTISIYGDRGVADLSFEVRKGL